MFLQINYLSLICVSLRKVLNSSVLHFTSGHFTCYWWQRLALLPVGNKGLNLHHTRRLRQAAHAHNRIPSHTMAAQNSNITVHTSKATSGCSVSGIRDVLTAKATNGCSVSGIRKVLIAKATKGCSASGIRDVLTAIDTDILHVNKCLPTGKALNQSHISLSAEATSSCSASSIRDVLTATDTDSLHVNKCHPTGKALNQSHTKAHNSGNNTAYAFKATNGCSASSIRDVLTTKDNLHVDKHHRTIKALNQSHTIAANSGTNTTHASKATGGCRASGIGDALMAEDILHANKGHLTGEEEQCLACRQQAHFKEIVKSSQGKVSTFDVILNNGLNICNHLNFN